MADSNSEVLSCTATPDGVRFTVRAQPGARRNELQCVRDGKLCLRLKAPAVEGAANRALSKFLGRELLGLRSSSVRILQGERSRTKVVEVRGIALPAIERALKVHLPEMSCG